MRVFLDDVREAPKGWVRCYWPHEVIKLLITGEVDELSLDHDLGDDESTGYDVLIWIEEQVVCNNFVPPKIYIHTQNPVAKQRMEAAVTSIFRQVDLTPKKLRVKILSTKVFILCLVCWEDNHGVFGLMRVVVLSRKDSAKIPCSLCLS